MGEILVVGSANVDMVVPVGKLPRPGETVAGGDPVRHFGGKGANQAVAAARTGGRVRFLGALGDDQAGEHYLAHLAKEGIDTSGVIRTEAAPTGTAFILIEDSAENMIVVSAGANGHCTPTSLSTLEEALGDARLVMLQLEIPLPAVRHVIREANARGRIVILNPSPLQPGFSLEGLQVDHLIVNRIELEELCGGAGPGDSGLVEAATTLLRRGAGSVIVTRGGDDTLYVNHGGVWSIPIHPVKPVDTVGAGDTFAGAFATAICEGRSPTDAIRFANTAAALATLALGAQEAMPSRASVDAALS